MTTRSNDPYIVGRLLGSVEAALAEAATPRAALGALRADVDECRAAIDALRESHVALEREDGALTEAQGQMREELDDAWRTRLPRLERLMFRLADRLDRVVDEAVAASIEAVNVRRLEEELGRLRVEIEQVAGVETGRATGEAIGEATLEAIAHADSSVNTLRAETAAAVESVRVETLARLERVEARMERAESESSKAVGGSPLGVESVVARVAAGLEPCVDVVTALAARVLGPGRSGDGERERGREAVTATINGGKSTGSARDEKATKTGIAALFQGVAADMDDDAGADLLGASLVVLAAEAAHAIAPRGPCRVATRVVRGGSCGRARRRWRRGL